MPFPALSGAPHLLGSLCDHSGDFLDRSGSRNSRPPGTVGLGIMRALCKLEESPSVQRAV